MMRLAIILMVLTFSTSASLAQVNSRESSDSRPAESWRIPKITGGYPIKRFPKALHSGEKPHSRDIGGMQNLTLEKFNKIMDQKIDEYYKRMKAEAREDNTLEKKMKKPQYSDFSYFGHKHRPKKHDLKHRKLCKECGIVH